MKNVLTCLACALALALPLASGSALAADPAVAAGADAAKIQKLRERIRSDHKGLVKDNLPLTEAEAKAFWPAFDKCQDKLESAQRRTNRAILDYVNGESGMTDARATQIVKEYLAAEGDEVKARKACYDGAAKVLPGKKAARFLQIENKIRALDRFDAAVAIPLIP
jgi:Spy/CpxP family protein refolding chaperone